MKTILSLLTLFLCVSFTPMGNDEIKERFGKMSAEEMMALGVFYVSTKYVHFDFSDSTLEFQLLFELDTFNQHYEFQRVSDKFSLKLLADRDSLRASPARPALNSIGNVTYNQFTIFND